MMGADEWSKNTDHAIDTIQKVMEFKHTLVDSAGSGFWEADIPVALINLAVALLIPITRAEGDVSDLFVEPVWLDAIKAMREVFDEVEKLRMAAID